MEASLNTIWRVLLTLVVSISLGCSDDDAASGGDGGGAGGEVIDPDVPPVLLPEGAVDVRSFFPVADGAIWRYRRQATDWQNPPAVTRGSTVRIAAGEGENEWIRTTTANVDLDLDGSQTEIDLTLRETFEVIPAVEQVGPQIRVKRYEIEERRADDGTVLRSTDRRFFPAYVFISDAWKTGLFHTLIVNDGDNPTRLSETTLRAGADEPRERGGIVNLEIRTSDRSLVIPMEGQYRDELRRIEVIDDLTNMATRTFWVQRGVGPVQWQFRAAGNVLYTLVDSNVERPPVEMAPDMGAGDAAP
jgi:hypothetical protein